MGRPAGHPKSGGRGKGTPNRATAELRARIEAADPVKVLIDVANGNVEALGATPTVDQRLSAAIHLTKKIAPDLKAVEMSGEVATSHDAVADLVADGDADAPNQ